MLINPRWVILSSDDRPRPCRGQAGYLMGDIEGGPKQIVTS